MTECETFKNLRKGGISLPKCPYDNCCDGRECPLLGTDSRLESPEDRKQEIAIKEWQMNNQKERLN